MSNESVVVTERNPDTVRGADISFYSFNRLPKGPLPDTPAAASVGRVVSNPGQRHDCLPYHAHCFASARAFSTNPRYRVVASRAVDRRRYFRASAPILNLRERPEPFRKSGIRGTTGRFADQASPRRTRPPQYGKFAVIVVIVVSPLCAIGLRRRLLNN